MDLREYFEKNKGIGVLATADKNGISNTAVFARPHVFDDGTVGSIMAERKTYDNLKSNPHASYLFIENGAGYKGKRLKLTKIREDTNKKLIDEISRRSYPDEAMAKKARYLIVFRVEEALPLIGS